MLGGVWVGVGGYGGCKRADGVECAVWGGCWDGMGWGFGRFVDAWLFVGRVGGLVQVCEMDRDVDTEGNVSIELLKS